VRSDALPAAKTTPSGIAIAKISPVDPLGGRGQGRHHIAKGDAHELDHAGELAGDGKEASGHRACCARQQHIEDQRRRIAEQTADDIGGKDGQAGPEGVARGRASTWNLPDLAQVIIAGEHAYRQQCRRSKRAEMGDEQARQPEAERIEDHRKDQAHDLFPDDAQPDFRAEHHAGPHGRGCDLDKGPQGKRPDEKLNRRDKQRPILVRDVEQWREVGGENRNNSRNRKAWADAEEERGAQSGDRLAVASGLRYGSLHRAGHAEIKDIFDQVDCGPQHGIDAIAGEAEHQHIKRLRDDFDDGAHAREKGRAKAARDVAAGDSG
jgi:hypothetical protein